MPIEILMPALSPTMEEGNLSKWLVAEGDTVSSGDLLAEIETDKATMEVEAVEEGVVAAILVKEGSEGVKVNTPIAVLLEDGEDKSAMDGYTPGVPAAQTASPKPEPEPAIESKPAAKPDTTSQSTEQKGDRIKASPLAKRIAKDKGLDLSAIKGSGPNGRIIKADVEDLTSTPVDAPQAAPQSVEPQ
ncbi:MAG: biotin/lipoyl-binding protein, partial [Acidimicrobiales bacterium]